MEPPVYSAPGRKGMSTGMIVGLVLGGIFLCCILPVGLLVGGGFWAFKKASGMVECAVTFQDIQRGILKYADAHGGRFPNAATWQDDVKSYYQQSMTPKKQLGPFTEAAPEGDWGCSESGKIITGMAFNDDLSGKLVSSVKDPEGTVLIFETEHASRNQHAKYKELPFNTSPMFFGSHRGWLEETVAGSPVMNNPKNGRVRITTGPNMNGSGITIHSSPDSSSN